MQTAMAALLKTTADMFAAGGIDTARLDAEILLAHVLDCTRLELSAHSKQFTSSELEKYSAMTARRAKGEPVAYITGIQPFWNHDFLVNAQTLIPRQDTETLVEIALKQLPYAGRVLDLGTGNGCILLSILQERPAFSGMGLDISSEALAVARKNAGNMGLENRVTFAESNWFSALGASTEPFNAIVANPPYIASPDIEIVMPGVRDFEPMLALDGGPDGLAPYRVIASQAPKFLVSGGLLAVEVGVLQSNDVALMFEESGMKHVQITRDLPGVERVVSGKK